MLIGRFCQLFHHQRSTVTFPKTLGFEKIENEAIKVLEENGFGVLTEINTKAVFKEKLGIEFDNYKIIGACNPTKAHQAISAMPEIGLLLPCNVIIYEKGEEIIVSAINPMSLFSIIDNSEMDSVAKEVHHMLSNTINSLKARLS